MSEHVAGPTVVPDDAQAASAAVTPEDQETIDQALAVMAEHLAQVAAALGVSLPATSPAVLRRGPLGAELRRLAAAPPAWSEAETRAVAEGVRRLFLLAPADPDRTEPPWFQATALGRLLARAEGRACAPRELLSSEAAAARLGVGASTIERCITRGLLDAVADESGTLRVPLRAIERCRVAVLPTAGDDAVLAEYPAAS